MTSDTNKQNITESGLNSKRFYFSKSKGMWSREVQVHGCVSQDLPSFHFVVLSMLASVLGFITYGHKMVSKALGNHSYTGKK